MACTSNKKLLSGAAPAVVEAVPAAAPVEAVAAPVALPVAASHNAMVPSVPYSYLPYATNYGYHGYGATPVVQAAYAPAVQATYAAAPVVHHAASPVVHAAAPVVQAAAPVVQATYAAAPVVQAVAPIVHAAAPVVHAASPVVQAVAPVVHAAAPVVHAAAPVVSGSQYHAQDEAGQYSFGYQDTNSVRQESKTADGTVTGEYQYVDADGLIQAVQYIADDAGFRVAGTNLPVFAAAAPADTPEVAAAKIQHAQAVAAVEADALHANAEAYAAAAPVVAAPEPIVFENDALPALAEGYFGAAKVHTAPVVSPALSSDEAEALAQGYYGAYSGVVSAPAPVVYNTHALAPGIHAAPIAVASASPVAIASADPVFVAPEASGYQYHSQDDIGQYSFGYQDGNSNKQEIKTADGVIRGSYSYVDSDGIVQTVNYIADALGFRVGATNLPVHNVEGAAAVAAPAVAAHIAEPVAQAVHVAPAPAMTPQVAYSYLPYAVNYGYHNFPTVAAAPQSVPVAVAQAAPVAVAHTAPVAVAHSAPVAVANAAPVASVAVANAAVPIVAAPAGEVNSQFHAQDESGSYSYGYNSATQAKVNKCSLEKIFSFLIF
jgi:hypothetical protein